MKRSGEAPIQQEIRFPELYRQLSRRWWWLVGLILLGGLLGLGLSLVLKAQFQATASLGVGIDFGRSLPLGREAERVALLQAQEVVLSDTTLEAAMEESPSDLLARNAVADPADLRERLRLERFEGRWELSVRATRPEDAAAMANAWASAAVAELSAAQAHSLRAQALQAELYETACSLSIDEETQRAVWRCQLAEGETEGELPQELVAEVKASRGILPALTFAVLREAAPPGQPIYRGRLALLVGGAVIGLALALMLALSVPRR